MAACKVNLNYISASYITQILAMGNQSPNELMTCILSEIEGMMQEDIARAKGYISKYDNQWDRNETDVSELKTQLETIEKNLAVIKSLTNS